MKKLIVLSVFLFGFALALNVVSAQEETSQEATIAPVETEVTAADLGVEDPGILPTSRIYFLKNWQRTIKRTFTFNPVKKAALELDIANQQAAEIAEMKEVAPDRVDAIAKASQNYQDNVDRLKTRLEALKETSQNPNVDKLMENLADRSVKHQQLFEELKQKFADKPELKQRAEVMQNKMQDALIKIPEKFDNPEIFRERMKRAIEAAPESPFKELRGMEMMEKIEGRLPEDRRAQFEGIKDDMMKKFEERMNAMPEASQKTFMVPHILERLPPPGDPDFDLKMKVLEDVKGRILLNPAIREQMEATQGQILEKAAEKGEITKEKAEEQIRRAEKSIEELRIIIEKGVIKSDSTGGSYAINEEGDAEKSGIAIDEPGAQRTAVDITRMKNLLVQAKKHLDSAKSALGVGKHGEAFGQATTAEMIARNALKGNVLFKTQPPVPVPASGIRPLPGSVLPPPSGTSTTVLPPPPTGIKPPLSGEQILCTQEYKPVCGINGKTYSNACHAKVAGVAIKAIGVCQTSIESSLDSTLTPIR